MVPIQGSRPIATNPATGAETEIVEITRKDRNTPLRLEAVIARLQEPGALLLANFQSGRAALQVATSSLTLDDGTVERRVRLIRPMEHHAMPLAAMGDTHWQPCDVETFKTLWLRELEALPEYTNTRFHMITGLLLPFWKRLPFDNPRVYRFTTDDGMAVIGRSIPPECLHVFDAPEGAPLSTEEAWAQLKAGGVIRIGKLEVRRSTVMHHLRFELVGFEAGQLPHLKALGLFSELIAWRTRLFVPNSAEGPRVLGRLIDQYAL